MSKEDMLCLDRLREVLAYNGRTGEWRWLRQTGPRTVVGALAGTIDSNGYRVIQIDGFLYRASRLAWLYVTGEWPAVYIDHADRNKSNDRWVNLREATHAQNGANREGNNQCSAKGVYPQRNSKRKPFIAKITVNGRENYLGSFATKEAAAAAYTAAAQEHFGEFSVGARA